MADERISFAGAGGEERAEGQTAGMQAETALQSLGILGNFEGRRVCRSCREPPAGRPSC